MGEILQNKYGAFRRCLAFLLSIVMVLSTMTFTAVETDAESDTITLNGVTYSVQSTDTTSLTVTDATTSLNSTDTLKDGDTFDVNLSFSIPNQGTAFGSASNGYVIFQQEITDLKNISFTDTTWLTFTEMSDGVTAYWRIYTDSEGKTYVQVVVTSVDSTAGSNITGKMTITATVNEIEADDTKDDGKNIEIGFSAGTTIVTQTVAYSNPGTLTVDKNTSGSATYDSASGNYVQTWTVTLTATNGGYVDIAYVSDTMNYMELTGSITVSGTSEGTDISGTYSSMTDLYTALANKTLNSGETITITYSTTITAENINKSNGSTSGVELKNTFTATLDDGSTVSDSANVSTSTLPHADKSYTVNESEGTITWTVKLYWENVFTGNATDDAVYVTAMNDTYTVGGVTQTSPTISDAFGTGWEWHYEQYWSGGCYWYYTYTTNIDNATNLTSVNYANTFTATVGGIDVSTTSTYTKQAVGVVSKTGGSRDADGYIDWTVTFTVPLDNFSLSSLTLTDTVGSGHTYSSLTSATLNSTDISSYVNASTSGSTVTFNFNYSTNLNKDDTIILVYKTQDTSSTLPESYTYYNTVKAEFDGNEQTDNASVTVKEVDALSKSCESSNQWWSGSSTDSMTYKLTIDVTQLTSAGIDYSKGFVIEDAISLVGDALTNAYSVYASENSGASYATAFTIGSVSATGADVSATNIDADGKVTLTVSNVTSNSYVYVYYTVTISDAFLPYFLAAGGTLSDGTQYIYNTAVLYAVDSSDSKKEVGKDDASAYPGRDVLTDTQNPSYPFVKKSYAYASGINDSSAEYVSTPGDTAVYTLMVNSDSLSLVTGNTITLCDKLGSGLELWSDTDVSGSSNTLLDTAVTVYSSTDSGNTWTTLTKDTDYTYSYDSSQNIITFTVPDNTYIKIVYYCKVKLTYGTSITDELTNNVYMTGYESTSTGTSSADLEATYLSTSSISGNSATLTLNKYSSNPSGSSDPIYGATFTLTPIDPTTGSAYTDTSKYQTKTMTVTESDSTVELLYDTLYEMKETAAPAGYTVNTEVYYIWIPSSNTATITLPAGIDEDKVTKVTEDQNSTYSYSYYDSPSNQLTIYKYAIDGSTQLAGAKFTLSFEPTTAGDTLENVVSDKSFTYNTDGTISFTTEDAAITLYGLPDGTYKLIEDSAPTSSSYVKLDQPIEFTVSSGVISGFSTSSSTGEISTDGSTENAAVLTVKNAYEAKKMSISLTKVDESGSYIAGVVFGLYSDADCTDKIEEITTDASGYAATSKKYGEGTYYLKEISVPTNSTVELSTNVYKVVITQNTTEISLEITGTNVNYISTSSYSITNNNTSMYIYKTDEENNCVSGAVLKISTTDANIDLTKVTVSGGATKTDATTNANGSTLTLTTTGMNEIILTGIPTGSYTLEEVSVPVSGGYAKADTVEFTVSLSTDSSNYGETLVTVTTASDTTYKSGSNGIAMIDNSLGTITINKVDATDTSSLLGGATLTVKANDSNVDLTKYVSTTDVSNATGVSVSSSAITFTTESGLSVVIENLPEGKYTLSESATGVPTGYKQADEIVFNVSVSNGTTTVTDTSGNEISNATVVMEDAPVGSVTIRKYAVNNANEKVLLDGAVLKITADASNTTTNLSSVKVSDVKGNTWSVDTTDNSNDTLVFTTNGANVILSNLPEGTYTLTEVTPPAGYKVADPITFTVTVDGSGASTVTVGNTTVTSVDMEDKAETLSIAIKLRKQDSDESPISGVVFGIYTDSSCTSASYVCSMTSVTNGYASSTTELEPGTYYLKETSVPDSYELSGEIATITVTQELTDITYSISGGNSGYNYDDNYYYITNYKLTMYIDKVDGSSNGLSGAILRISTTDASIDLTNVSVENVADSTTAKSYIVFTTNGDQVVISGIPVGEYTLEEVSTPDTASVKYVKADTITFTVSRDTDGTLLLTDTRASVNNDTTTYISSTSDGITMVDCEVKTIAIKIHKIDDASEDVSGVVFGVYDENGTLLETMTATDENGYVTSTNSYPEGTYYIKEITPASGYIPSTTEYKVVITQTTTEIKLEIEGDDVTATSYEIVNNRTSVQISKVDATSQEELAGAEIQIIGENGVVVAEWTSSTSPVTIYGLATGKTYTLREKVAPEGYDLTTDTTFILNADGTINTTATTTTIGTTGTLAGVLLVEDDLKATTTETTTETTTATTTTAPESTTATTTTAPESTTAATTTAPESTTAATTTAAETEATTEAAETTTVSEGDSNLIVEVLDEDTGEPVEGAVVRITDEDGNTVDLVTGKDGKVYGDFEIGDYTIEVISVPDGYTVTTGQKTTVTLVENETAEHQAIVSKLDGAQLGDSDSGILPITGMLVWPISVLSILGAMFMAGGVIDNRRKRTK